MTSHTKFLCHPTLCTYLGTVYIIQEDFMESCGFPQISHKADLEV